MRLFKTLFLLSFLTILPQFLIAQMGCPGCLIDLPEDLPEDTIFIGDAATGHIGTHYDADISFRMPKTTTPVNASDPEIPAGFDINSITISGVSNLPPGLSWEASQLDFIPSDETDGCVKLCGTPLQSGLFEVEVNVTAQVFVIQQSTSFTFPVLIVADTSATDGFTLINDNGCGEVTASFINNIPSGGVDGFSYTWDFGNGNSSIDESPTDQTYSEPGLYEINYQAIVDTSQYYLTHVTLTSVSCSDLFNGPDLYIEISDPDGEIVFQPAEVENASLPMNFDLYLPIGTGDYTLRVIDDDQGVDGGDDICGVVNFSQLSNGVLNDTEMSLEITILHQVDTINSVDTVWVYEIPDVPMVTDDIDGPLCKGDVVNLTSSYETGNQWVMNNAPIEGATMQEFVATENGSYQVEYTSPDGCNAISDPIEIAFNEEPPVVPFVNENNLLQLSDPGSISDLYNLSWLFNDSVIPDETMDTYCINENGVYSLVVTDITTGCKSVYSSEEIYNPDFPDCMTATNELETTNFRLYPNPVKNLFFIEAEFVQSGNILLELTSSIGQSIYRAEIPYQSGMFLFELDMSQFPDGFYSLGLNQNGHQKVVKLIKTK
jgi:hypothetical protein